MKQPAAVIVLASLLAACAPPPLDRDLLDEGLRDAIAAAERDAPWVRASLERAYGGDEPRPIWVDANGPSRSGEKLIFELFHSERAGLPVPDLSAVTAMIDTLGSAEVEADRERLRGAVEARLSVAYLERARDLLRGHMDPDRAGQDWEIEPEPLPADPLGPLVDGRDPDDLLAELAPALPEYGLLIETLARLRGIEADGGWPEVGTVGELAVGRRSAAVSRLRDRLAASDDPVERRLAAQGSTPDLYDADLASAFARFQRRHGLSPDGVAGAATLRELDTPVEERIRAVEINLDRIRWLPRTLGEYAILVNVAGFEFQMLENDRPAFSMNVVVGAERNATRIFASTLDRLVLNPYWNVPSGIAASEILPAARQDPGYLARNGFELVGPAGTIPVDDVDLGEGGPYGLDGDDSARDDSAGKDSAEGDREDEGGAAGDRDWRVRQRPGPANALGQVKFMFPNPYDIYLHDTPEAALFERSYRAFSHGCIRLERPLELAEYLMARFSTRSPDEIDGLLAAGKEVVVPLREEVRVYIVYLTTWAAADGTTYFYRDIYDRDDLLERSLEARRAGPARRAQ